MVKHIRHAEKRESDFGKTISELIQTNSELNKTNSDIVFPLLEWVIFKKLSTQN